MNADNHTALDAAIAALGLEYKAEFVPQRLSRNVGNKHHSLNWRVTLARNGHVLTTDYMQGVGYIPDIDTWHGYDRREIEGRAAQEGRYRRKGYTRWWAALPAPSLRDVLYSLVLDAAAMDSSFDDWCGDYGYDTDSRKAEAMYRTCRDLGHQLAAIIGRTGIAQLRELFQDY